MKKTIVYILLTLHLFISGNFSAFFSLNFFSGVPKAQALSSTWNFNTPANYTLSNSNSFTLASGLARLSLNFNHLGSTTSTTLNGAYDLIVEGNYAYMTSFLNDSFSVVDISNPVNPTIITTLVNNNGTLRLNGAAGLVKNGNYIYIASQVSDAIQIIDVSSPTSPIAAGNIVNSAATRLNGARAISIQGSTMYVMSDIDDAVQTINILTPTNLVPISNYRNGTFLNGVRDIKISGNYAFVSSFNRDNFAVLDISDPANITYITELQNSTRLNGAWGVKLIGTNAYVSSYNNNSVEVIDISNPTFPSFITSINTANLGVTLTQPRDIAVSGDILYIAGFGSDNIIAVDVSTPSSPVFINQIVNAGTTRLNGAYGVFKNGLNIYAASYVSDAIEVMNLNYDSTSPTIIPTTAFTYIGEELTSFTHTLSATNSGSITYQISKNNGTTWYWWNGTAWVTTTGGVANSSTQANINANLSSFNALIGGTSQFKWKAFFTSNGIQKTEINTISVSSTAPPTPGPGGVSSGLNLWLKSNAGTSTTTNGANLATWSDQSGNGKNATAVTAPTYRNNTTDNVNFYPVVNFNGSNQSMVNTTGGMNSKNYFAVVIPTNTTNGTTPGGVPFGLECTNATVNTGTCGLPFGGLVLGSFTAAIPDEVITHGLGASTNWRSAETGVASYDSGKPMLIAVNENIAGNGTDIYEKGIQVNNYTANTYQFVSGTNYSIGASRDGANPFYFNGKVAEIINFDNRLSDTERIKIESYLSLKYGITLKNGTQNYIASDGSTLMWNTTTAGVYNKNIFGIGRDNLQSLSQVQSKSINNDSVLSVQAIGEGTNLAPTFVDITDKEFFTIGNNNDSNTWSSFNSPVGYNILSRKWKAQEIGDVGTMNFDLNVANLNFDIPAPSLGINYYFIYDSNNNGNLADEIPSLMTNIGGNIWRAGGLNIANGQIFTIASQTSTNNIPSNIFLSPTSLDENSSAGSLVGSFSTTDADPLDTHSYSLVSGAGDTDNSYFSISGVNIYLSHIPDYEIRNSYSIRVQTDDGNGGQFQKFFTVSINNIGESITSFLDFESILNNYKYSVSSGNWSPTTTNPYAGTYSMESNNGGVGNSQSCFEITHNTPADSSLSFQYNVSSQNGGDFLRFYIDNVEQGVGWSGIIPWTQYTAATIPIGNHIYKWCYIKDGATNTGLDRAFIDDITFSSIVSDTTPPTISSLNYASGSLLPGGNHNIIISYSDLESGINTASANIELYKWDGVSSWGANIAGTGFGTSTITTSTATYPTNNLSFGKYLYAFQIADNDGNTSTATGSVFYIDQPEFLVSTGSIDIGGIDSFSHNFSNSVTITVKTVGAGFNVIMNSSSNLMYTAESIESWNGTTGFGYDTNPYTNNISTINSNQNIASQVAAINTNGFKNTYTYEIKLGALVDIHQSAGDYLGNIDFGLNLIY